MKTKGIWAQLRDIATSEPGDEEAETEKGMAIAALVAAYRFLLKKRKRNSGVGGKELQIQLRHHSLDQVNEYLRQMGVWDLKNLQANFPAI